jgi:hypothetical protein
MSWGYLNEIIESRADNYRCPMASEKGWSCRGSKCMAWKWSEHPDEAPRKSRTGFCGMVRA